MQSAANSKGQAKGSAGGKKHFTPEEINEAKGVDLIELLLSLGVPLEKHGGGEYMHAEHDSLKISRHKGWYWNSRQEKGNPVDYLMKGPEFSYDFRESVEIIRKTAGLDCGSADIKYKAAAAEIETKGQGKRFYLPKPYYNNRKALAYLCKTRRLDYFLVKGLLDQGAIYESNEYLSEGEIKKTKNHNVVFVGYDFDGEAKYAFQRGTSTGGRFACDTAGSDKRYGFRLDGSTGVAHVFESPIDALSFKTLQLLDGINSNDTYISSGTVSSLALDTFLKAGKAENIRKIHVRADNDDAGRNFSNKIKALYGNYYIVQIFQPINKDYNEDLVKRTERSLPQSKKTNLPDLEPSGHPKGFLGENA